MLLLIAVLTILVVIPLIVVLLARPDVSTQQNSVKNTFSTFRIEQVFDPDHAIIWDTQLPALQLIASAGEDGLPVESLRQFYARSCREYPELYDGSTFESWLEFLKREELIWLNSGAASLRTEGRQLLHSRVPTEVFVPVSRRRP